MIDSRRKGFFSIINNKIQGYIKEPQEVDTELIIYKTYNISSAEYQKKIIKLFIDSIESQNELSLDTISAIEELIINVKSFPNYFFKEFYNLHNNSSYIQLLNEKNLEHFGNILMTIILLKDLEKNDLLNIIVNIIYYGEKIYYSIPNAKNKKLFLCSYLNKFPIFKCIYFWEIIIRYKLISRLEKLTLEIEENFEKINRTNKKPGFLNNFLDNNININDELNTTDDSADSSKGFKKNTMNLKNIFNNNKHNEVNGLISIINYEANFEELTPELKNEYIKKANQIFHSIVIEYI